MNRYLGRSSIQLDSPVYIQSEAGVVGTKEGQGPLGKHFDYIAQDDLMGAKCWEEAESRFQKKALSVALEKGGLEAQELRYLFAGDLIGQSVVSSFGLRAFQTPIFGLYGACSTCGEALTLGAMTVAAGFANRVGCVTSSHFASAEKEFRFPIEYGNQRPMSAGWTVTGSGAFILGSEPQRAAGKKGMSGEVRIAGMTVGSIVDFELRDSMNLGACMAPAAADTILQHFSDWNRKPDDYDRIITGDLGMVGKQALFHLLEQHGISLGDRYMDCGIEIFDESLQDTHAGGSGCGCCASVLACFLLQKLRSGEWKRILFLPTGALLSKTSYNEGKTVPAICHGLVIENA